MPPKVNNSRKAKLYNSRTIRTQLNDLNFVDNEKLNIPEFLKSRAFEIKSFELSQLNSKYATSNRIFQSLPRVLRRRAASHNVKRIPKRLRNRALKEMKNSVNGLPLKKHHLRGRNLYKLTMTKKLLKLGSRLKLLKNIPEDEIFNKKLNLRNRIKLINDQIEQLKKHPKPKLNNILGSYDNTGTNQLAPRPMGNLKFFKRQTEFVWLPTHIWHAKRFHMIKKYGYQIPLTPTQKCFKLMNRSKKLDSILFDTSYYSNMIVEINDDKKFKELLLDLTKYIKKVPEKVLNGTKSYDGWIYINNMKIGQGLIYSNANLNKLLVRVFPSLYEELFEYLKSKIDLNNDKIYDCRYSLGNIEIKGPNSLISLNKIFHLFKDDQDSKILNLWYNLSNMNDSNLIPNGTTFSFHIKDPRFWKNPVKPKIGNKYDNVNDVIIDLSSQNLINLNSLNSLFDNEKRNDSYNNQLSNKLISKEFSKVKPSENSIKLTDQNKIPILITKLSSGSWNIVLPWYWLMPVWIKLIKVTHLKVGGLNQLKQFNFENLVPNFPNDYQFLKDGWLYNEFLGDINEKNFNLLPKSKQIHFKRFEIELNPFKCDWTFLQKLVFGLKLANKELKNINEFSDYNEDLTRNINTVNDLLQLFKEGSSDDKEMSIELFNKHNEFHQQFINNTYELHKSQPFPKLPINQVSVKLINKGKIKDNARIYGLVNKESAREYLNNNIENKSIPDITKLIGFITSGSLNLDLGTETGMGLIKANFNESYVLVRNIGCSNYYIGKWEEIRN